MRPTRRSRPQARSSEAAGTRSKRFGKPGRRSVSWGEPGSPSIALKLTIVRGGGLAGITRQTELASDVLPTDDAATLHDQVEGAEWLHEDAPRDAPSGRPDEMSYEV